MTRYSASRGMLYTAPPGPTADETKAATEDASDETGDGKETAEAAEPTPADD